MQDDIAAIVLFMGVDVGVVMVLRADVGDVGVGVGIGVDVGVGVRVCTRERADCVLVVCWLW